MSEQDTIDAGRRVAAFLADEAVKGAWVNLEKRYFADFKRAKTAEEREQLHARITALDDLFETVLGTVQAGKVADHARELREQQEARKRTPRSR